jgi:hypothetical protein
VKGFLTRWRQSSADASYAQGWKQATDEVAEIRKKSPKDLAVLIAAYPHEPVGELARSEQRVREAWRSPAKWTFVVSLCSLAIAILALIVASLKMG